MDFSKLKTLEATIVLSGSLMGLLFGKFWIVAMALLYVGVNVPNLWNKIKAWLDDRL